jgi:transketolase|tara:strand:+ start:744 stop:1523 length:780 start_codon:yes stop_codon:yes gene_type:complete
MNKKILKHLIYRICKLAYLSNEGHVPSALSVLDIVWVIYSDIININLIKKKSSKRDIFIMSKGHGCLAQYAVMEEKKFFKKKYLDSFGKFKSKFGGHPDANKINGIEASTGSLGHGFPFAAGIAYANKLKKINSKIISLVGDGECNEGTIWETCLLASHHKLNNLTCIVDNNQSSDRALKIHNIKDKFTSFGWKVIEVNGHSHTQIIKSLKSKSQKPTAIIANTIKGKGVKIMEKNQHEWHHKNISMDMLRKIKIELKI